MKKWGVFMNYFLNYLSFISFIFFWNGNISYLAAQNELDTTKARSLYQKALQSYEKADYTRSITQLEEALLLYKKTNNWLMCVDCQQKNAQNYLRQGKVEQSLALIETTLNQELPKIQKNTAIEAELYATLGEVYLNKGRNDLAMENLQKSLDIYTRYHPQKKQAVAHVFNTLGLVYWNKGNRDLALDYQLRTMNLRQEIYPENHPEIAASYNDIGLTYSLSDTEKALENYLKALKIYQAVFGENHPRVATLYNNVAIIYFKEKSYSKALENFEKVLTIWENVYGKEHPNVGFVYNNIAQVYLDKSDFFSANDYAQKALQIYQKNYGKKHPETANVLNWLGTIHIRQNLYTKALQYYQEAMIANVPNFDQTERKANPDGKSYYNSDILLNSLLLKAQALEALHIGKTLKVQDLIEALDILEICDQLIETIRQLREKKSDKIALGQIASEVYEDAIRILMSLADGSLQKKTYFEKAFYFAEKSKSKVLLEAISDTDAKDFANIPSNLIEQEKQIKSDIAFYEQKLAEKPASTLEKEFREKLFALNQQYTDFIKNLENQFPEYFNLKYNVKSVNIKDIQKLLDDRTLLIHYFLADKTNRIFIFYISQSKFWIEDVAQNDYFQKYLTSLRSGIQFDSKNVFLKSAYQLYKQLFPKRLSKDIENLLIIPDGRLGTIPFEVLIQQNPSKVGNDYRHVAYLIRDYSLSYHFSANLFYQTTIKSLKNPEKRDSKGIFLCAPISFEPQNLVTLPATETEVYAISSLFKEKNLPAKIYLKNEASEKIVKSGELKNYQFVHFATHGVVNEDNPELSQIFLKKDSQEDGNFYSGEIYNIELPTDLVFLSACETGLGKVSKGEGIIGLSRALLFAGTKNLMVSLWTVGDQSTSDLVINFYKHYLNQNSDKLFSNSLRQAKLKMIESEEYFKPYYWAPFILVGH